MMGHGKSINGHSSIRPVVVAACLAAALASPTLAQQVILKVNGEVITNYDIEQRGNSTCWPTAQARRASRSSKT